MHTAYIHALTNEDIDYLHSLCLEFDANFKSRFKNPYRRFRLYEQILGIKLAQYWGAKYVSHLERLSPDFRRFVLHAVPLSAIANMLKPISLWQVSFNLEFIDSHSFIVYEEGVRRPCAPII